MGFGIALVALLLVTIWLFLRYRGKTRTRAKRLPEAARKILRKDVAFYQKLNKAEKRRFEDMMLDFLARVTIDWVGGEPDEKDRVLVAASAVIPIFGFDKWRYQNLTSVVIYPDTFNHDFQFEKGQRNILGMVGSGFMNGQMVLSQRALRAGFKPSSGASNTGIHEFVHLLDDSDGAVDGIPENLMNNQYILPWLDLMQKEMQRIQKKKSDIDAYAATGEQEFLAVAAEYFFERPDRMKNKHPELYELLEKIFHQSPDSESVSQEGTPVSDPEAPASAGPEETPVAPNAAAADTTEVSRPGK
jgi:MtfA peptidase